MSSPRDVTDLLVAWNRGDQAAFTQLVPLVYDELRRIARRCLRQERPGHTLAPTALVHEAYARLIDKSRVQWQNRAHFLGVAAQTMRQILVDYARKRHAARRGGARLSLSIEETVGSDRRDLDLIWLDEALSRLAALDAKQSQIVELRYFTGMTIKETAEVLAISAATVKREWDFARAWLHREMSRP
ncbi:MAG TPA: sigma-70 family RNA polymerase sigma factor [Gemmatimonadales bacterium]|nr:sigma-70 family RNA polymerase sigma factor [Gemmatimonadales bacterium]